LLKKIERKEPKNEKMNAYYISMSKLI